jgi:hypothetical protein
MSGGSKRYDLGRLTWLVGTAEADAAGAQPTAALITSVISANDERSFTSAPFRNVAARLPHD